MANLVSNILNGTNKLVFNEAFCLDPRLGLTVEIPAAMTVNEELRSLFLKFIFDIGDGGEPEATMHVAGDTVNFFLSNYASTSAVGTVRPYPFTVNGEPYYVLFWHSVVGSGELVAFSLSVYYNQSLRSLAPL